MLCGSRATFARTAVAFFNMKHFQTKKKYNLTPQNIYETFSTVLLPRDRLLRQSVSGGGGSRVLVLDAQQRVKGVYLPVFCMPHPSTITNGSNSLGVAVADYTRSIEAASTIHKAGGGGTASTLPTVLVVLSHPQGLAYGTFRADGTPGVPMKNLALSPILANARTQQASTNIASTPLRTSGLGTVMPLLNVSRGRAEVIRDIYKELNECEHVAELAACSTFVWVQRDNMSSMTFETAQSSERYWEREKNDGDGAAAPPPGAISFLDRRWVLLMDVALHPDTGLGLYARDPATGDRIVNATGVQSALCRGLLLLDHVPRTAADPTRAADSDTGSSG
ncbi:conserved hypothetical protein [Leishmania infantum JPCM5]|uniref:Uncharacterized protein n=3 Tax=Leishmania donovani species complex TaxID=38574 RepID=A4ICL6_LEIIN|nr:conserved hypothetical protein [Leishmania infantum JPCM5]XP_003865240.1 hypothetical protein, conserved [Leishmania donovani]CAC9549387.1 hypothetical_protein_-_conserved [Leishmania infantum]AYU83469.1 hypothetical protein LdCL_360017500 [Leishmania donovani]TPP48236.1 hypothetical protein CGC21_12930 [Leishmania donovani]CAM72594.1 conserved hypothetical protein [Leishmania infantum JPCM5]CBZ38562.1 hypothetical protein, conserved [Leishmania donovani]|eukprot:XP_001469485.1 conserved hypothetical protein [Leishmania infantum JPCM5]